MTARPLRLVLGAGAFAFGVYGIAAPRSLARMVGSHDATLGRELGFRDLGNALVFAAGANRIALAQRMLYDVSDAIRFGRAKPAVGVSAFAFAGLGAFALAHER